MRARLDSQRQRRHRVLRVERHRSAGSGDNQRAVALDREGFGCAGRRGGVEDTDSLSTGEIDAAALDLVAELPEARVAGKEQRLQPSSIAVSNRAEHRRIGAAVSVERDQLAGLPAFGICNGDLVARIDLDQQRAAARNRVAFGSRRQGKAARPDDRARARWAGDHLRIAKSEHRHSLPARADLLQRKIILTARISEGRQGGKASQRSCAPTIDDSPFGCGYEAALARRASFQTHKGRAST